MNFIYIADSWGYELQCFRPAYFMLMCNTEVHYLMNSYMHMYMYINFLNSFLIFMFEKGI